jgi:hypothetical protein
MVSQIWVTTWKGWNELWRRLAFPRVRLLFASNGIFAMTGVVLCASENIVIGNNVAVGANSQGGKRVDVRTCV